MNGISKELKKGENGLETLGFNSPSHNPENEQVQYLQKIAQCAENTPVPCSFWNSFNLHLDPNDFLHEVQFSAAIEAAHFLAETTRPLGPRLSAFSPSFKSFVSIRAIRVLQVWSRRLFFLIFLWNDFKVIE